MNNNAPDTNREYVKKARLINEKYKREENAKMKVYMDDKYIYTICKSTKKDLKAIQPRIKERLKHKGEVTFEISKCK